jgi:hypothetical protein
MLRNPEVRPPEQKISYPIKRSYESENFGQSIVFDLENFSGNIFWCNHLVALFWAVKVFFSKKS